MAKTWRIGDVTVTKIVELEHVTADTGLWPLATPEALLSHAWLRPHFVTDKAELKISIHALVVETPTRRIIVDTCVGNDKQRTLMPVWHELQTPFLEDLAAAGFPRESIDAVVCTHLHLDHVGWNTMLVNGKWIPTFPNARYLMGRREYDHWHSEVEQAQLSGPIGDIQAGAMQDSVKPVFDAGLVDLVETDHRICEEVSLIPTVGHTPGHVSVEIVSKGERALITGDFIHHPCQFAHPDWYSSADYDTAQSTRTRREVFGALAGTPTLVIGTHFAGPTTGHIVHDGEAYRLDV